MRIVVAAIFIPVMVAMIFAANFVVICIAVVLAAILEPSIVFFIPAEVIVEPSFAVVPPVAAIIAHISRRVFGRIIPVVMVRAFAVGAVRWR